MSIRVTVGKAMEIHVEGYGDMTEDVARELAKLRQEEHQRDVYFAAQRQAHINRVTGREAPLLEHGQLVASIDQSVFSHWEAKEGRGFFGDKSSRRAWLKKFPECAVKGIPRKLSLLVGGLKAPAQPSTGPVTA